MSSKEAQAFSVEVFRLVFIWQVTASRYDAQVCFLQMPVHREGLFEVEEVVFVAIDDKDWALHSGE